MGFFDGFDPFAGIKQDWNSFGQALSGNFGPLGNQISAPFGAPLFPGIPGNIPGITQPLIHGGLFNSGINTQQGPGPAAPGTNPYQPAGSQPGSGGPNALGSNISDPSSFKIDPSFLQHLNGPGNFENNASGLAGFFDRGNHYVPGPQYTGFNTSSVDAFARNAPTNGGGDWTKVHDAFQNAQNNFSAWETQYPKEWSNYDAQANLGPQYGQQHGGNPAYFPNQKTPWILDQSQVGADLNYGYRQAYNNYAATGAFGVPGQQTSPQGGQV